MFHSIPRSHGGNIPDATSTQINKLFDEFALIVSNNVQMAKIPRAVVRNMLQCNLIVVLDSVHLFVAAEKASGMPSTANLAHPDKSFRIEDIVHAARWEFGFEDPFVIRFPAYLLNQNDSTRQASLEAIARTHIQSEVQRTERIMNIIQINPIFGPASYAIDPRLAFVLMPFTDELTEIYNTFVKPTVEEPTFNLVCRRADDVKSNKAIIQDIWKSICEARLIIADLSGLNPNVMYELGIAHTLGKETILIYQRGRDVKFPFDLSHIRRIEYDNNAVGGKTLQNELRSTLTAVLTPDAVTK